MNERYFAYGSNLSIVQLTARIGDVCLGKETPKIARLPNHRLAFNMWGGSGQVYANLVSPGPGVYGVTYTCSADQLAVLDGFESGYQRRVVRVVLQNGDECGAITYIAETANVGTESRPSAEYLQKILLGARRHGLPDAYIREIEILGSRSDQFAETVPTDS